MDGYVMGLRFSVDIMMPFVLPLDWRWGRGQRQREEYKSILNAFIDKKDSYYSIHQIGWYMFWNLPMDSLCWHNVL